jgi:tetratricopeptide (TPR) repeat protein
MLKNIYCDNSTFQDPVMPFKKLLIVILILNGLLISIHAQQLSDSAVYNAGILKIQHARTASDFSLAAAYFGDLSASCPSHWLSLYYEALCYIQASHHVEGNREKDGMLDKAQPCIDKAIGKNPEESEILALQAFLYQSRIQVNPQVRGMSYSSKAEAALKKATLANDKNPRAWSLLGYNLYYTPAFFGGGAEKALPFFIKARDKYKVFNPLMPFFPHWGEPENQQMISECNKSVK